MNVAIVGAGLQGRRRAVALMAEGSNVVAVADVDSTQAQRLADVSGAKVAPSWEAAIERDDVDAVLVCTPPHLHEFISVAATRLGKHVLCEKPLARTVAEAERMVSAARASRVVLKCGFNLRHHPVVAQLRSWVDAGEIGEIYYLRGRYGIGGRPGYDQEWRANAGVSGGGQLMDQGIHLLDLARWFLGDFTQVDGSLQTYFWDVAPLEDNAFALLTTSGRKTAMLHASWTQWKPLFSLELTGRDGYAIAEGLGGAYGVPTAILGRRDLTAPFAEHRIEFRGEDASWRAEWREFSEAIQQGREPVGSGEDGLMALQLVEALYGARRNTD
jgi:predicted dehydrogenase